MQSWIPFVPESDSNESGKVDALYCYLSGVTVFFTLLIALAIPFVIAMSFFVWGAQLFFRNSRPPTDALEVYVVGKQWMWKFQHTTGQREINELHVPVGRKVKLIMASEDVIHDVFVPAFLIKMDVVPGKYTSEWFEA